MTFDTLRVERQGPIARVTCARPDVRNALNAAMIAELTSAFAALSSDDSVRVVVLQGEGSSFKAGRYQFRAGTDYDVMISPDGHYFAYQSDESGRPEIYVRPFPRASEGRWQVSIDGGTGAIWARSGRELFYLNRERALMSVAV